MKYKLQNSFLSIVVDHHGAEMQSLKHAVTGHEFLWQPGHEFWPGQARNLFPNVGLAHRERAIFDGVEYPMIQHGFAKDLDFELQEANDSTLVMTLRSSEITKKYYPYEFRFSITYRLEYDTLTQVYTVCNDDTKEMPTSFGAHTGFYCPIDVSERPEDYVLEFEKKETIEQLTVNEFNLLTGERKPYLDHNNILHLHDDFFNQGPHILTGFKSNYITLRSRTTGVFVKVNFKGFPYLTLWSKPTQLYFLCIEPWCGLPDSYRSDHIFRNRPGVQIIPAGNKFSLKQAFQVGFDLPS